MVRSMLASKQSSLPITTNYQAADQCEAGGTNSDCVTSKMQTEQELAKKTLLDKPPKRTTRQIT